MTELLRGLIRAGLVCREPTPHDRRSSVIRITEKGRGTMKTVMPDYYRKIQEFSAGLKPSARKHLMAAARNMMADSTLWRQSAASRRHVASRTAAGNVRARITVGTDAGEQP